MKKTTLTILFVCLSGLANADCIYNGSYYPTGTKLGSLTCQPNGSWQ